jgi:hypothetical protein
MSRWAAAQNAAMDQDSIRLPLGAAALGFSVAYFASDVVEALQGGFSTGQLLLTLVAEAAIPVFVLGLWRVQEPRIGRLGAWAAGAYALAYVFFTWTVAYALYHGVPDYDTLSDELGTWMFLGGAVMVVAGLAFGLATIRAGVLPRWSAVALMAGVVLVAATQNAPDAAQLLAAGIRDLGFAGMGAALLVPGIAARPRLG